MTRVQFHRLRAGIWLALLIPALIWWREEIWFVIVASVYANIMSDWGAAEAADDRQVMNRLDELEQRVEQVGAGQGPQELQ